MLLVAWAACEVEKRMAEGKRSTPLLGDGILRFCKDVVRAAVLPRGEKGVLT